MVVQPASLAFETLLDQTEEELSAKVTKSRRFITVDVKRMRMDD